MNIFSPRPDRSSPAVEYLASEPTTKFTEVAILPAMNPSMRETKLVPQQIWHPFVDQTKLVSILNAKFPKETGKTFQVKLRLNRYKVWLPEGEWLTNVGSQLWSRWYKSWYGNRMNSVNAVWDHVIKFDLLGGNGLNIRNAGGFIVGCDRNSVCWLEFSAGRKVVGTGECYMAGTDHSNGPGGWISDLVGTPCAFEPLSLDCITLWF